MIRNLLAGVSLLALVPSAFATMPNPNTQPWNDHSKPIRLGADIAPQHYATITLSPKGEGKFAFDMRCENGQRGSKTDGTFHLTLIAGDQALQTIDQYCGLGREESMVRHQVTNFHQDLDLSEVIDRVTAVKISAEARWTPPQEGRRPNGMYPAPVTEPYRQPGQPATN